MIDLLLLCTVVSFVVLIIYNVTFHFYSCYHVLPGSCFLIDKYNTILIRTSKSVNKQSLENKIFLGWKIIFFTTFSPHLFQFSFSRAFPELIFGCKVLFADVMPYLIRA